MANKREGSGGRSTSRTPTPRPGPSPTPTRRATPASGGSATGGARPANDHALVSGGPFWGNPDNPNYAQQNIVTINVNGLRFQVNGVYATQFTGLIRDLIAAGYKPKSVQGYNNRPITGGTGKSNHAYGAAIDIDPGSNPRYDSKGGKHALPDQLARELAAKWGFVWGGDYKSSKDYMHFEALGAPRTPGSPPGGTVPPVTPAAKAAGAPGPVTNSGKVAATASTQPAAAAPATATAAATTTAGGTTGLPANATPQQIADAVSRDFGYLAAFLSDREIGPILRQAAIEDWDESRLMGALSKTNFWKNSSATTRQWDALNKTDHATAKAQVDGRTAEITARATKAGLILDPLRAHDMAVNSLRFGWNDQQLNDALAQEGKLDLSGKKPNDALSIRGTLKQQANAYLVPIADAALDKWTLDVVSGRVSQDAFTAYLKVQAKSLHPEAATAIDSGVTTEQYYDPYKQLAASNLDIAPESINFNDPKWARALYQVDPKTGARTAMSLAKWQETLRTDPVYGYQNTAQAKDTGARFTESLLNLWGAVA